jgi:hypothetical protein
VHVSYQEFLKNWYDKDQRPQTARFRPGIEQTNSFVSTVGLYVLTGSYQAMDPEIGIL